MSLAYYHANKEKLNYRRKLNANKKQYPFITTHGEAEYWIKVRKYFLPFSKILKDNDDVDVIVEFMRKWLEFKKSQSLEKVENVENVENPDI